MSALTSLPTRLPYDITTIAAGPRDLVRGPSRLGLVIVVLFFGGFLAWGGLAPLAGGAIAPGVIAPEGSVRTVQHLEGGIVKEILVREGARVEAGAPLLSLQSVAREAEVATLLDRRRVRLAEAARLEAELARLDRVAFSNALIADPSAATAMAAEERIFDARLALQAARERVLQQRIEQLNEQIGGFSAQVTSAADQLDLVRQEIADKQILLDQGLTPKVEMLRLRRAEAEISGFKGEYTAQIARARQQIGETEIELLAMEAEQTQEASLRVSVVQGELTEIEQALVARQDVLGRTMITAPVPGVVSHLRIKTEGGVIAPGAPILDLVPTEEKLGVDLRVSPSDVDLVSVGMTALVHLSAFSDSFTPRVTGRLTWVAAEGLVDQQSGQMYFAAKVEVDRSTLEAIGDPLLSVGMPAEVTLVSHERTMIDYLLEPLVKAMRRAGREV